VVHAGTVSRHEHEDAALPYGAQAMVAALVCLVAASRWWTQPTALGVIVAEAMRAAFGLSALNDMVWVGSVQQDMTWHAYRGPDAAMGEDGRRAKDIEFLIGQMRRVEERVEAFAGETGMERIVRGS
jgi:hypothetical protein